MNIKTELIKPHIANYIISRIEDFEIDADLIANTTAIIMLDEIQKAIKNEEYTDFEVIERIIEIFEECGISYGSRHDF